MKTLKNYVDEKARDAEYEDIISEFNSYGQLYSGNKSKSQKEQDQEDMSWSNRHGYRDGKIWHDIFQKDWSSTIYGRLRQFFKNAFAADGFDISRGDWTDAKHVTSVPADVKALSMLINGTEEVKKTARKKTGIDDLRSKKNESLSSFVKNSIINEEEEKEEKGPTGFPGTEALLKANNKYANSKQNSTNIYMTEKKLPLGVSIFADPNGKVLKSFREECKDEKYKDCPHIFHLEFIKGLENEWPKFFKKFVLDDIEKQFEMKKQTSKEKKEVKKEIKNSDDGLPPATDRTITISYLDDSFEKFYASLGFKTYDKKNHLMVAAM